MSFVFSSSLLVPSYINTLKECDERFSRSTALALACNHHKFLLGVTSSTKRTRKILKCKSPTISRVAARGSVSPDIDPVVDDHTIDFEWGDRGDIDDTGSPWEGAIVYRRNASVSHVEYCTTLERLGLGNHSTDVSKSRASSMGLRITKAVKDYPLGTPVQVSIDVTRKMQKLRLDGIIRTVLSLGCNRCGEAAAECIFTNFSLLLTEDPIEEPEMISMGVILGEDKFRTSTEITDQVDEEDDALIELDDWLYFPPEEKEIDISKHIRDMVHVEITFNALCDPSCKGLCLKCGMNLNTDNCNCREQELPEKGFGPLGNLRKQMQKK